MQLVAPDVDGVNPGRPAREQNLGEPARRGADIKADEVARIDIESVEPPLELQARPRDPRMGGARLDGRLGVDQLGGLRHDDAIGDNQSRLDGGARLGPALEQAAFDKHDIGAAGHWGFLTARDVGRASV